MAATVFLLLSSAVGGGGGASAPLSSLVVGAAVVCSFQREGGGGGVLTSPSCAVFGNRQPAMPRQWRPTAAAVVVVAVVDDGISPPDNGEMEAYRPKFPVWKMHLDNVLDAQGKRYVIEKPISQPTCNSPEKDFAGYFKFMADESDVMSILSFSTSPEFTADLRVKYCHEVVKNIESQVGFYKKCGKYLIMKEIYSLKLEKGQSVKDHLLEMRKLFKSLSCMAYKMVQEELVHLMWFSLTDEIRTTVSGYIGEPKRDVAKLHEDILASLEPKPAAAAELMDTDWIDELGDLSCPECGSKDICAHSMDIDQLDIGLPDAPGIFMINCLITSYESWVLDTGSGNHICNHLQGFNRRETLRKDRSNLRVGEGTMLVAEAVGSYSLSLPSDLVLELENCYYVPKMIKNVISFDLLVDQGFYYKYDYKLISCFKNDVFYFKATPSNGLYVLNLQENKEVYHISKRSKEIEDQTYLWHCRLGHINKKRIEKLQKGGLLGSFDFKPFDNCESCLSGKMTKQPFNKDNERANELLGIIHTDVCGPFSHVARGGYRYFITFTDDFSRYGYVYLIRHKSEAFERFKEFQNEVQNQLDRKIKFLRSDRGGEYLSLEFDNHLMECGIVSQLTPPYTPQMNGVSERRNRTLLDMVRSMMCRSSLPVSFWGHALETAAHILNRVPTKSVENTPYEIWMGKKPKLSFLKIWGCEVYVKRPTSEKLKPKSDKCFFVGYPKTTVGYYFYNPTENKVFVSRNGEFLEDKFLSTENTRNDVDLQEVEEEDTLPIVEPVTQQEHVETQTETVEEMQTQDLRRSTRIRQEPDRYLGFLVCQDDGDLNEPTSYVEVVSGSESEQWQEAMKAEMQSMYDNQVWELTNLPQHCRAVGRKWVFKKKIDMDGNVHTFKARLVAKGFTQTHGIDYDETFSPVAMLTSIRILMAISAYFNYEIWQMDVKTAFLNGKLTKDVYMQQPEDFVDPKNPDKVCKLLKSIYGLKQASRSWNLHFDERINEFGFAKSEFEPCVYTKFSGSVVTFLVLYVDDILLIGNDVPPLQNVKTSLSKCFQMKDLGEAAYILGRTADRRRWHSPLSSTAVVVSVSNRREAMLVVVVTAADVTMSKSVIPFYTPEESLRLINCKWKLTGQNFPVWKMHLDNVLRAQGKLYVLEKPVSRPESNSPERDFTRYFKYLADESDVMSILIFSTSPEFTGDLRVKSCHQVVKDMENQLGLYKHTGKLLIMQEIFSLKLKKDQSVKDHLIEMRRLFKCLSRLGYKMTQEELVYLMWFSLTKDIQDTASAYMKEPKNDVDKVHEDILASLEPVPEPADLMDTDVIDELGDLTCPECGSEDICEHSMNIDQIEIGLPDAPVNLQDNSSEIYHISKRSKDIEDQTYLWHCRLGHINKKRVELILKGGFLGTFDYKPFDNCESCLSGKMTKQPFNKENERATNLLEIIHTDVCGPFSHVARGGYRYFITFTDDFSRYGYVYLMRHKSESFERFREFHNEVQNQLGKKIKFLRSNRGGEYLSDEFDNHLMECGIISQLTPPYTPQMNGVSERKNRTLLDMVYVKRPTSEKLKPKSDKCFFVGYPRTTVGYYFYNPEENKVFVARNGKFLDEKFLSSGNTRKDVDLQVVDEENTTPIVEPEIQHENVEPQSEPIEEVQTQDLRRSSRVRQEPDRYLGFLVSQDSGDLNEPTSYGEAVSGNESEQWQEAMEAEMQSMYDNQVWELTDLPQHCRAVGRKWVFKKKTDMDGNVHTFKARLVAKGFTQTHGIDYDETFSPVAMLKSIRILMAISAYFNYEIWQMDVKTAFLNGKLTEDVYMEQPEGFEDPKNPNKVCKLLKSIYGLKQASRSWNLHFDERIKEFGFAKSEFEPCVYTKFSGSIVTFLVLYVDDILLIGNDVPTLQSVKSWLNRCFQMKDLGEAAYILGIKIYRNRSKRLIGLSQSTYIDKILKRFRMDESKKGFIPMQYGIVLNKTQCPVSSQEQDIMKSVPYASAIGSIMYAMLCTRPDVAYSVAVKNILKYLRRTKDMFLVFGGSEDEISVTGYSDASFQTDRDDFRSQSGYVFTLNGGAISWKSSKQDTIADSTTEAEVVASISRPIDIFCDNSGAVAQAKEPREHHKSRYVLRKYHLIREIIGRGDVRICKIPTEENVADPLTKPLARVKHEAHANSIGMQYLEAIGSSFGNRFVIRCAPLVPTVPYIKIYRNRSRWHIGLSQGTYIDKILKRFRMDESKKGFIPMQHGIVLSKAQCPVSSEDQDKMKLVPYASVIGSIMYAMLCTRPDVAYSISVTSRYQQNPGESHWVAVKNILKYMRQTKEMFLVFGGSEDEISVAGYSDATSISRPIDIYCDNSGAVAKAKEPREHHKSRHVLRKYHLIREIIGRGDVRICKIPTDENVVDPLTKPLARAKHEGHASSIGMQYLDTSS
ncbi:hypothetical protein OSB04_010500 [Centaurea solstitialis]|uniref:Integrase catalytic domain-containing protein n=1 Tax=Centaurea solstitialis TaxID=347529 RepID=A0AA38TKW5_9ASTR|nr:hypothetical protein OSB04_010500 [Centaurea solstitialis]